MCQKYRYQFYWYLPNSIFYSSEGAVGPTSESYIKFVENLMNLGTLALAKKGSALKAVNRAIPENASACKVMPQDGAVIKIVWKCND